MRLRALRARTCALALALCLASTAAFCPKKEPDPDGSPGQAHPLELGSLRADQLFCRIGDCADWFRFQVTEQGDVVVLVESPVSALGSSRPLAVVLADGRARQLERRKVSPVEGSAMIRWEGQPGHYMVRVESQDEDKTPLPYELALRFVPPPPPPPPPPKPVAPQFDLVVGEVLEVEGGLGDPEAVLVDRGESHGLQPQQRGRLKNGDEVIGTIVVIDTYPDGSRARIEGTLTAPVSPQTRVEIDVPRSNHP